MHRLPIALGAGLLVAGVAGCGDDAATNAPPQAQPQTLGTDEDTPLEIRLAGTDPEGDTLSYFVVGAPQVGELLCDESNRASCVYHPPRDFAGEDSFQFAVNDGNADSPLATISIAVTEVNDPPVAELVRATTTEDTAVELTLEGSDIEGAELTYVIEDDPTSGTVSCEGALCTYTPAPDFHGRAAFSYRARDAELGSNPAPVMLTVTPVNDPPTAESGAAATPEDGTVVIGFFGSDPDGDALSFSVVTPPEHGSVSAVVAGRVTYTPNADFSGSDSLSFVADDGQTQSEPATINITVSALDDPPVAAELRAQTDEDTETLLTFEGSDPEGATVSFRVVAGPAAGRLSRRSDDSYAYTPNADFNGDDLVVYAVSDGESESLGTVAITVAPVNDAPTAAGGVATTTAGVPVSVFMSGRDVDGDRISYEILTQPTSGTLEGPDGRRVIYTPGLGGTRRDSFTFRATDGEAFSEETTFFIDVVARIPPPTVADLEMDTDEDTPVTVALDTGAAAGAGGVLRFEVVSQPLHGTVSEVAGTEVVYTPDTNYHGGDRFSFRAVEVQSEGSIESRVATVQVNVASQNDAPIGFSGAASTEEDRPVVVRLEGSDADGDALSFQIEEAPQNGSLGEIEGGRVVYTPAPDFNGDDIFRFRVSDGEATSGVQSIIVQVAPVNDPPVAQDLLTQTDEDTAVEIDLGAASSDPDGAAAPEIQLLRQPLHGTLSDIVDGVITYTPNANYHGDDIFLFAADDGDATSGVATATLSVASINDPPTALASTVEGFEDNALSISLGGEDPDGDALAFAIVAEPENGGLSAVEDGGVVYTPAPDFDGEDSFSFTVDDGSVQSEAAQIAIDLEGINDAPRTSGSPDAVIPAGTPWQFLPESEDPEGDALSFTIFGAPDWMSVNDETGMISGNPGAADEGVYTNIVVLISDGQATTAYGPFDIQVIDRIPPGPPTLFKVEPFGDGARLTWALPADEDVAGVIVRRAADTFPTAPQEGEFVAQLGPDFTEIFDAPRLGRTWYYTAFAFDDALPANFSPGASAVSITQVWRDVSAGGATSFAIRHDGRLWAAGRGDENALGSGATGAVSEAAAIAPNTAFESVSSSGRHGLAIAENGALWVWGSNEAGQLGTSDFDPRTQPAREATGGLNWAAAGAGGNFSVGLRDNGTLWAWGGDFGDETPAQVGADSDWTQISAGTDHALALKADGSLWAFGDGAAGQLGLGDTDPRPVPLQVGRDTHWAQVAAGNQFSLALRSDGTLWFAGRNDTGEAPELAAGDYTAFTDTQAGAGFVQVSAANGGVLALRDDASLLYWGDAATGLAGDGAVGAEPVGPTRIGGDTALFTPSFSAHIAGHAVAMRADGALVSWGASDRGQTATGCDTAGACPAVSAVADMRFGWDRILAGTGGTLAVRGDGRLSGFGMFPSGRLFGNGDSQQFSNLPIDAGGGLRFRDVAFSAFHVVALGLDGSLWSWGSNDWGRLGLPVETLAVDTPTQIDNNVWLSVAAGTHHSLAVRADGTLWSWGADRSEELGWDPVDNCDVGGDTARCSAIPGRVGDRDDWARVWAKSGYSHALRNDGSLFGFGFDGAEGRIGDGSGAFTATPAPVCVNHDGAQCLSPLTDVEALSHGLLHHIARKRDGTHWAFGRVVAGNQGANVAGGSALPHRICLTDDGAGGCDAFLEDGSPVIDFAAGDGHSLFAFADGSAQALGVGAQGQLGTGVITDATTPTELCAEHDGAACSREFNNVQQVFAGSQRSYALRRGGTLWAFGYNGDRDGDSGEDQGLLGIAVAPDGDAEGCTDGFCSFLPIEVE